MDLTTTLNSTNAPTNTADAEKDTPPPPPPPQAAASAVTVDLPMKPLSFTNGARKDHPLPQHNHHRLYPPPPRTDATYRECLKNHAAAIGGHAVDGCGEFMGMTPSPAAASLTCAACGCHRNFHRREEKPAAASFHLPLPVPPPRNSPESSPSPPPRQSATHVLLALSSGSREEHLSQALAVATPATPTPAASRSVALKRFRTKFSLEQKEEMFAFSKKLGWKMQGSDGAVIEDFCRKIGVTRGVLKVWMHNNKHTFAKKDGKYAINSGDGSSSSA